MLLALHVGYLVQTVRTLLKLNLLINDALKYRESHLSLHRPQIVASCNVINTNETMD
jgi:hypothetical protein